MGPCVRSLTAASAFPDAAAAAIAAAPLFSLSSSSYISKSRLPTRLYLPLLAPLRSKSVFRSFEPVKDSGHRPMAALFVDYTANDKKPSVAGVLPELMITIMRKYGQCGNTVFVVYRERIKSLIDTLWREDLYQLFWPSGCIQLRTEFMVDMKCEGCASAVKDNLLKLDGVKSVNVDLSNQVVQVLGSPPVKTMADALKQTGRKARLIGQGNPNDFLVSAAVAEFKGPVIFGVVRIAQVNMELARIEASFSGLSPGRHGWAINQFGDLTRGAESTGKVYNPANISSEEPLGDLGTLEALENGDAQFSGSKPMLRVLDLIGRSVVVYETENKSDSGIAAAVIARSAGIGENYKKLCTCDGVTIWESK